MKHLLLIKIKQLTTSFLIVFGILNFNVFGQSVFISQYIETSSGSTPKGIEIYNNSGADIVFSAGNNLQVYQGTNGGGCSALAGTNTTTGTLRAGEVWVIGTSNLTAYAITNGTALSGTTDFSFAFNGDDALQVYLGGVLQDVFGTCGTDPGSNWSGGGVSTSNNNIQINNGVCIGTTSNWTNPSLRFNTVAGGTTMTGFGDSPASCVVPACTPPTITSITPTSGPAGTLVTINATGGGFTGSTDVTFNGAAAVFTVVSNTKIEATVPAGATSGDIVITDAQPCDATYATFTIIDEDNSGCEGSTVFSDLIFSEIYDQSSGSLGFVEIYNGTGATIDLSLYFIRRYGDYTDFSSNQDYTFPSMTIASGEILIGRISTVASGIHDFDLGNAPGINGKDRLELYKYSGTTLVDVWQASTTSAGYTDRRVTTITGPNTTYTNAEWTSGPTNNTSHLGTYDVTASTGVAPSVTTNPSTNQLCAGSDAILTAAGTEGAAGGLGLSYQWFVSAPGATGWTAVTNTGDYSGATTATLTVSPSDGYDGYQYYCQIREDGATCYSASDATQLDVYGSGGVAGRWTGNKDTDWCDCFNWDDGKIPTATTDVLIYQTAVNSCIVGTSCGAAVARSVTLINNSPDNRNLTIANAGNLNIVNHLDLSKVGGSGTLSVETTGNGVLIIGGNTTISGSATGNALFRNQSAGATLDVNGNFTIQNYATLDLNANGTLNLAGDFINNNSAAAFDEGSSTVIFDGAANQNINTTGFTEAFHNITLAKTSGTVILQDPISLDATGILALSDDQIQLNGKEMTLNNPSITTITRTSGSIVEESGAAAGANTGKLSWNMGTSTGVHIFPFAGSVGGTYIPFSFNLTSGNVGTVSISTYHTVANNQPWPASPVLVTNLNSTSGLTPDNRTATADRFWQIDKTGATGTADLTFSYMTSELPAAPYNTYDQLIAQRYNETVDKWETQIHPGQTRGNITGGHYVKVPNISTFSPWALAHIDSPLPAELIDFDAKANKTIVDLTWTTASEINVSHFVVERSKDGQEFSPILTQEGAGNSTAVINYVDKDYYPFQGESFYRLLTIDFDGSSAYSATRKVYFEKTEINVAYTNNQWILNLDEENNFTAITVVNSLGAIVDQFNTADFSDKTISINNENYAGGIYFLLIHDAVKMQSIKVIK